MNAKNCATMNAEERPPAQDDPHQTGRLRSVERLILISFAVLPLVAGVGVLWHLSFYQISCLLIGVGSLMLSWVVWRHGIIAYSHEEGLDRHTGQVRPPTTTVVRAPLRRLLAPVFASLGVAFLLAGSRTSVGAMLHEPALVGIGAWSIVTAISELLSTVLGWALLLAAMAVAFRDGILRRDREALVGGGCLIGLLAFGVAANVIFFLIDEAWWRRVWSDFFEPVRVVLRLFT